jgi:glycosyltransferase involved in cell wall biosynthesis
MKFVLAITTYNRINFLKECIRSWINTRSSEEWKLIIADDGSTDGTREYLQTLNATIIFNQRNGVAHQTNTILSTLNEIDYDLCFKCDDDILFTQSGWEYLYWNAIKKTGYEHLVYDNPQFNLGAWCKDNILSIPKVYGPVVALAKIKAAKGCFYTITKSVQQKIGYMDTLNFLHGYEHVDFSTRCARANLNDSNYIFDAVNSNEYINYRFPWHPNQPSINSKVYQINGNGIFSNELKLKIIENNNRIYIPLNNSLRKIRKEILFK